MSNPWRVPSRSIEVSRISPAPSATTSLAYAMASSPVGLRPPWVKISQRAGPAASPLWPDPFLASIATTMHWSPNFSAASLTKARLLTAAVLIDTLSAPARSSARMSSMVRTTPPNVTGHRRLDRVAGVAQVDEVDAFDDASVLHVEAGYDANFEHGSAGVQGCGE